MSKITRAIEELAKRAAVGDVKAAEGIRAYHGSPYSFDEFSTSQIGTGEGAQAYSRGLYFAEREKTAEGYRDRIAGADWVDSSGIPQQTNSITSDLTERLRADGMGVVDADQAATMWSIIARDGDQARNSPGYPVIKKYLDEKGIRLRQKGSMYEVNIDATPDEFIDWDLPLDEQSESVMNALKKTDWYEYAEEGAFNAADQRGDNAYGMDLVRYLEEDGAEDAAQMLKDAGIKGVQYADAQTRFGKGPKTKNYVVYDDRLVDITKKYGISIPLATAVLAGTMTPEEAQAGPLSAGRRIIDPRFSGPVGSGSTRKGVLSDLEGVETTVDPRLMNIGRSEALYDYEGSPYILTQSDRSAAGGVVTSVKGKEIDPVNLRGGRDFMFDPQSGDLVWASDPAVVKSMYKRALELRKLYGKDPLLLPYTMAPTGIDFATMPLDVMINYARQGMGRSDIKRLDEQIRKVIPSWKGVMNPEANAVFREVHGNKRKAVANIIDKQFRDVEGGLSMGEARAATSDAAQYMAPDGSIQNIGQIEISDSSSIGQLSDHPTYRGGLKGQGIGKLDVDIDARELMEDKGRELTGDAADIRALSMNHELSQGVVDEKLLRRLYDKQRPRIEAISEKFGVSIPIAAMALMGEPEEAQAGPISAAAKRAIDKGFTKDVYHGTTQDFDQIDLDAVDLGVHVGTPVQAKNRLLDTADSGTRGRFAGAYDEGANIMPLKARMNNTLHMPDVGDWKDGYQVLVGLRNTPIWRKNSAKIQDLEEYADEIMGQYYGGDEVWRDSPENREILDEINTMLSDSGYDSIMYRNDVENAYGSDAGLTPAAAQRQAAISKEINALDQEVRSRLPQLPEGSDPDFDAKLADYIAGNPDQVITPDEVSRRAQLLDESRAVSSDPTSQADPNSYIILDPDANLRSKNAQFIDERGNLLASVGTGLGVGIGASFTPEEAQAGMGGMGVRSAPVTQDEEAIVAAQQPAPTGADLMQQANDDFLSGIINQPGSFFNPETYDVIGDTARGAFDATTGFLGDMEQMLVGGIMQGIGGATTWEDALKMIGGGLGQEIINAPEGRGSRFMEGMKNYDPAFITSGEVGQVPGIIPSFGAQDEERTKRAKMLGGFFAPI